MFKCEQCKKVSLSGEPQRKKVVETRSKEYPARKYGNVNDPGGVGTEIVKEIVVCTGCY